MPPKLKYKNEDEWQERKDQAFKIIEDGLFEWIVMDELEYEFMEFQGLTLQQQNFIPGYIEKALFLLTKDQEWSENIAHGIVYGIKGFIESMIKLGVWEKVFSDLSNVSLSNMIYSNIIYQLDDNTHSPCLLEDVPEFEYFSSDSSSDFSSDVD